MKFSQFSLSGVASAFAAALTLAACASTVATASTGSDTVADVGTGDGSLASDAAADDVQASDASAATDDVAADATPSIDNLPCPSGQTYKSGESNDMQPGAACIQCHGQQDGPSYLAAGTVFRNLITQTGCYASGKTGSVVPPAAYTVELTDANGTVFKTTTSTLSGNFHLSGKTMSGFTPPYSARVIDAAGNDRKMRAHQTSGDCNGCHTATGANGAPGRIVAPSVP